MTIANHAAREFTADVEQFITPVCLATGRQRWSKTQNKHVLQSHYSQGDHITANNIDELWQVLTAHGKTLKEDTDAARTDLKNSLPFYFAGGLANGGMPITGSGYDISYAATKDPENEQYRRRNNSDIAACSMITLDIDEIPAELVARLTGDDDKTAVMDAFCGFIHSTASSTPAAPRVRIGVIFSKLVAVSDKAEVCARFERQLMTAAGAVPAELPGHYTYNGQPVSCDPSVYRDVQVNYMPSADCHIATLFDGQQIDPDTLPELPADVAAAYARAGKKTRDVAYDVPANGFTGAAAELEAAAIELGFEPLNKPGLYVLSDHPFKSDPTESRAFDTSFALQIDQNVTESRFQSERQTWRDHCNECTAAGKSAQYAAAIELGFPPELARAVWGGEFFTVANADDFPDLEPANEPALDLEDYRAEADPFANLAAVDIFTPPGLLGDIYRDVERLAHRSLPMASIAAAIQLAAVAGGLSGKRSLNGGKLSPLTITLALSASGKEQGQSYVKNMLDSLTLNDESCVRFALAKPRSDKEVMRSVLRNAVDVWETDPVQAERAKPSRYGTTLIVGDEADQLFSAMGNKNAATSTAGIGSVLLEVITANRFSYSGLHREEELSAIQAKREALENKLEEAAAALHIWDSGEKLKRKIMSKAKAERISFDAAKSLARLQLRETLVIKGVRNPVFCAMLSAVPATFSRFISDNAADSGLLSRALILLAGESVGRLRDNVPEFDQEAPETAAILRKLRSMIGCVDFADLNGQRSGDYVLTPAAIAYRAELKEIYESEDYREHPTLGAIYRRAMLRIDELATLAALDSGSIDVNAFEWAAKLFNVSTASMKAMIDTNNAGSVSEALKVAIVNYLQDPRRHGSAAKSKIVEGTTRAKAIRQARKSASLNGQPDPFDVVFNMLVKAGVMKVEPAARGEMVTLLKKL